MTKIAIAIIKTIMNKVLKANIKATHLPDMRVGPSGTINMVTNFPLTRIMASILITILSLNLKLMNMSMTLILISITALELING